MVFRRPFCGLIMESAERKVCYNRVYPNTPQGHYCARRLARFSTTVFHTVFRMLVCPLIDPQIKQSILTAV